MRFVITEQERFAEQQLVERARGQDEIAWTALMRQHQEAVFRLAYLILGDAAEAEEAAQDAFVRAYLSLASFDVKRPFRPWLMQIGANVARNRRRSLGRYAHAVRQWWQTRGEKATVDLPSDDAQLLWLAVKQLNQNAQEVVYLRYFLEMSERETADILNIAPGTVKSRLHRALKKLRSIIETEYAELMIS